MTHSGFGNGLDRASTATQLDTDDVERISHLDRERLIQQMAALRALPMARNSADYRFANTVCRKRAIDLTPAERHQVAMLCWAWRRRGLPPGLSPKINPGDPLSPDRLAMEMGTTPTLAMARMEMARG